MLGIFDINWLLDRIAQYGRLTIGEICIQASKATLRLNGDGRFFFKRFNSNKENKINNKWSIKGFGGDSVYKFQKQILSKLKNKKKDLSEIKNYLKNLEV